MIKKKEQWITYAKPTKKQLFFYEDKVLDLTNFMSEHPGGRKALANYVFKDITEIIFVVFPHKREPTLKILLSYVIGKIPPLEMKQQAKVEREVTPSKESKDAKDKKKVCFIKNYIKKENKQSTSIGQIEDSWKENDEDTAPRKKKKGKGRSKSKERSEAKIASRKDDLKKSVKRQKQQLQATQESTKGQLAESTEGKSLSRMDGKNELEDLDEEKPIFRVPVLNIKHMYELT